MGVKRRHLAVQIFFYVVVNFLFFLYGSLARETSHQDIHVRQIIQLLRMEVGWTDDANGLGAGYENVDNPSVTLHFDKSG